VLRRDPPAQPRGGAILSEAAAMRAAARQGVPEPTVVAAGADDMLGAPFMLTTHVAGETIARRILREERLQAVRPRLAAQCGDVLGRIHSIPAGAVPGLVAQDDPLERTRDAFDAFGRPHPAVELGFRWLMDRQPPIRADVVVHGDFRNGNLIVDPEGIKAVLDWEVVHLGDPMEDLGWLCVKAWRFGSPEPVGGFGPYDALFEAYERRTGATVDPERVRWWQAFGTLRWAVGCMTQCERHLSGAVRSVELAAIGRRVCEQEHDLLLLFDDTR